MNWTLRWTRQQLAQLPHRGELRVLGLALMIAVAAGSAVQIFSDRVGRAINAQSGETLGADLIISGRQPLPDELNAALAELALAQTETVNLPSVVWKGERSELGGIKAVSDSYPLKGALRTAPRPYETESTADGIPPPGEAWADIQLWSALELAPGDTLEVGGARLTISALLTYEPDRGAGFVDLAPRLLINARDLPATGLIQPGSRAQYRRMLAGEPEALGSARAIELPRGYKRVGPRDARPEIRSAVERAESFLALAAMTATLLGAIAIALCAHQYGRRLEPDIALLRCLGAPRRGIVRAMLLSLGAIGLVAGGLGAVLGLAVQFLLTGLADALQIQDLPPPQIAPALQALGVGLLLLAGFALPPLLGATHTPPVRVFQRGAGTSPGGRSWTAIALLCLLATLWLQSPNASLIAYVTGGQLATALVLALLVGLLLRLLAPLRRGRMLGWRLGLGNLLRRPALTLAQSVALGLGLLALLLLTVVRGDLLDGWQNKLPPDTPNQFLINIQGDQLDPLRTFLADRDVPAGRIWPMARARLVTLNGESVNADDFADPETQRWINRDFNLSWSAELGDDNRITDGQWWGEDGHGQPWLSADTYARERLELELGDVLGLDLAGQRYELEVTNFREVDWESFQPNFFLMAPPGVLDETPASWLTSFYLPPDRRAVARELTTRFPNITMLDLDAMMQQVRDIMQRIVGALETVFLFTIAAGLTVLLAAMEAGRHERAREIALLRTLGARRRQVRSALLGEFLGLGLIAGLTAAAASQAIGWTLARYVFKFDYSIQLDVLLAGGLGGALLVAALAWLSLRRVLDTPPGESLR